MPQIPKGPDIEEFLIARNHALKSLDEATIKAYCRRFGVRGPNGRNLADAPDELFWSSIHMARCELNVIDRAGKLASQQWLNEHGMRSPQQQRGEVI